MATETDRSTADGFGQVSRTVGTVFRYLLLVATLSGIVALAVLLAYVFYDAVQPDTAGPGWYLVYFLVLVLPTIATGGYLRRRTTRGLTVGGIALAIPVLGVLFGAGVAMLFIDIIPPVAWLGYTIAFLIPLGTIVAIERSRGVSFLVKLALVLAVFLGSMLIVPGIVASAPVLPANWLILVFTLGTPVTVLVWRFLGRTFDATRWIRIGAALTFGAIIAGGASAPVIGLGRMSGVILTMTAVVPFGLYAVVSRYATDPATASVDTGPGGGDTSVTVDDSLHPDWIGLGFPVVVIGGMFLGAFLVEILGFTGPQSWVDWQFLTSPHRNAAEEAGVYPAIIGSIMLMIIVALVSFPLGVGAAVYLEEYAPDTWFTRIIDVNISNLAGVPSVVYGLLGLGLFVTYVGSQPGTVLVGGLTLALLILPIVIISAREAIRSVPDGFRQASYGMGATRWQTIKNVILPEAFPGILTGTILALGRAIGETAPLLVIGAPQVFDLPSELSARVGALPLQIYVWATAFASPDFFEKALPAGVIVLLVIMLVMNSVAIVLRNRFERGT